MVGYCWRRLQRAAMGYARRKLCISVVVHSWELGQLLASALRYSNQMRSQNNIFTLAFSAASTHVMCGGLDDVVRRYDVETQNERVFRGHSGTIRQISNHPAHDYLFLSACEDGTVVLYDARTPHGRQAYLSTNSEFSGCTYHPVLHDLFLTTDARGRCYLRDARMAFETGGVVKGGAVRQYVTTVSRRSDQQLANPEASSVAFDSTGERFAIVFQAYYPTIYATFDEYPIAICNGANSLDATDSRTYANCCTTKHGSFGGTHDSYYGTGSDDFRGYAWKLPDTQTLVAARQEVDLGTWVADADEKAVGFTTSMSAPRVQPLVLDAPAFRLTGHSTIVNSLLFHPHEPLVVTSGVESFARLHSPFDQGGFERTPVNVRELPKEPTERERAFLRALRRGAHGDLEGDEAAIAFFDEVVREESGNEEYMFVSRPCGEERPTEDE
ncbi:WD40 repeat-like protein [Exidia glandulosa HHB12029]|uniref:WD40 repeat-like protein n=1 Tax=Exidia glandulosa HHB12029 TaxID=1314781 RepID=A0A166AIT0_EXIGL|nr:WD40 repeat-like protein [Exidia glandulosa HHB12029]